MFGGFYDDPFFGFSEHQHRSRHLSQFEDGGRSHRHNQNQHQIEAGPGHASGRNVAIRDPFDYHSMFSNPMSLMARDPFHMFDSVMSNMRNMGNGALSESFNSPDGFGFSSVSVSSYIDDGNGQPKIFQASKSTKHAPGGMKETHRALRDTEIGMEKMSIGRHIKDRGHVITRERNARDGQMRENQDYIGFREDEAGRFDQEWMRDTSKYENKGRHYLKSSRLPVMPSNKESN